MKHYFLLERMWELGYRLYFFLCVSERNTLGLGKGITKRKHFDFVLESKGNLGEKKETW